MLKHIRFLHLPKTAGTTFNNILFRAYPHHYRCRLGNDVQANETCIRHAASKPMLFVGHSPACTGIDIVDTAPTIVFLRDPVARVQSFCQHVFEGKSPHLLEAFPPESFDLDRFLGSKNVELSNLQTRMLMTKADARSDGDAQRALAYLLQEDHLFGIQEFFDESLLLMQRRFGWNDPVYVSRNQKSVAKRLAFSDAQLEKIVQLNRQDITLYQAALQHFKQRCEAISGLQDDVERFRRKNMLPLTRIQLQCSDVVTLIRKKVWHGSL